MVGLGLGGEENKKTQAVDHMAHLVGQGVPGDLGSGVTVGVRNDLV